VVDLYSLDPVEEQNPRNHEWLGKLQGNILRGHGRDFGVYLFFSFGDVAENDCRVTIRELAARFVTSALQQYKDTVVYRETKLPGPLFGSISLTPSGYARLGFDAAEKLKEPAPEDPDPREPTVMFLDGMKEAGTELGDPSLEKWDPGYRQTIDAMLLLADDDEGYLGRVGLEVHRQLTAAGHLVHACERGRALRNEQEEGIEHFGYVDGRSQPLFLADDFAISPKMVVPRIRTSERDGAPIEEWDPFEPLGRVLLRDPFGPDEDCHGSFLVFRKLEQDVRGFCEQERALADYLGLEAADRERAGAMVVGRFRDGSPLALSSAANWHPVEDNNFTFLQDPGGARCPYQAHIRKVNPRGDSTKENPTKEDRARDRERRITRRSITYGRRRGHPSAADPLAAMPSEGVGLLFMCFQASIRRQFAFIQKNWCNDNTFIQSGVGVDPLIGQGADAESPQEWPGVYNKRTGKTPFRFNGFIRFKGGEFFFAPSIPFLRGL
jgi:Dyp-type peroxidase family